MDYLLEFPPEIQEEIFNRCPVTDLTELACCSTVYSKVLKPKLWECIAVSELSLIHQDWMQTDARRKLRNFKHTKAIRFCTDKLRVGYNEDDEEEERLHFSMKKIINYCNREKVDTLFINLLKVPGECGHQADGDSIDFMCKSLVKLKSLSVRSFLLPVYAHETIGSLRYLTELDLSGSGTYDAGLIILFQSAKNLRMLNISNTSVTDKSLAYISKLKKLHTLWLADCAITNAALTHIGGVAPLRKLDISSPDNITSEGVDALVGLTSLSELHLSHSSVSSTCVAALVALSSITILSLANTRRVRDEGLARLLKGKTHLTDLDLSENRHLTDTSLRHLASLTKLKKLNVKLTHMSDEGLSALGKCRELTALNIGHCKASPKAFTALSTLTSLRILFCDETLIGDGQVGTLTQTLVSCLEQVDLSYTDITNTGMRSLATLSGLRTLNCRGCNVTPKVLKHFPRSVNVRC